MINCNAILEAKESWWRQLSPNLEYVWPGYMYEYIYKVQTECVSLQQIYARIYPRHKSY